MDPNPTLDILEIEEPESSYDASVQTQRYREQYPVVRRLFASGFLRCSPLRQRIEPLFGGANSPIQLVIRASMIGHKQIAKEMETVRMVLLGVDDLIDDELSFEELKLEMHEDQQGRISLKIPEVIANLIVEYWYGYYD